MKLYEFYLGMLQEDEPTDVQKKAGNYKMKHITWNGLNISIENPANSYRSGTDGDGIKWRQKIYYDYGYICGTKAIDGDQLDIFMGPNKKSEIIFVVNQTNKKGEFDEHKVILGADTKDQAERMYLKNYEKGWDRYDSIISVTIEQFKDWIKNHNIKKPIIGFIKENLEKNIFNIILDK